MTTPSLNPQLSRISSFHSLTPGTQVSSGGQTQTQQGTSSAQQRIYNYQNTYIIKQISSLETMLSELISSVERFEPNTEVASALVSTVDQINAELVQLEIVHDLKKDQVTKQNSENKQLNDSLKTILLQLNDCRRELNGLPKLSTESTISEKDAELTIVDIEPTKQLLEYAMKLAKFSKVPRAFDGFLLPNNFVWPGDDNMRRGMLATASLMPNKLIESENGVDLPESDDNQGNSENATNKNEHEEDDEEDLNDIMNDSDESKKPKQSTVTAMDLFESDDEEDD